MNIKVWELVDRPAGSPVIKGKWVFTTKKGTDGEIKQFKDRFVAKDYSQIQGVNYEETFSPTISHVTDRTLLAIAAERNMKVAQYGVKTAYLNSPLDDNDFFIELPQGSLQAETKVCRRLKILYGLKQAGRCWNIYFHDLLLECGLIQPQMDPCLYFNSETTVFVLIWVDDIATFADTDQYIHLIIEKLSKSITLEKRGQLFLGMKVKFENKFVTFNQKQFIEKLI